MRLIVSTFFLIFAVLHEIGSVPLNHDSAIWHKITKRNTAAVVPPIGDNNKNNGTSTKDAQIDITSNGNEEDELIETRPDSRLPELGVDEKTQLDADQSAYNSDKDDDSNSDRSIDWQLLSGNPADLERELESRRRRRSVRASSLSRQHRIRTTGRQAQRSRSKRDAYYSTVNPSDLLAAYAYLQARREQDQDPQLSLLNDVNEGDLSNLASLIYELQRAQESDQPESTPLVVDQDDDDDQQVLPDGYVEFEPTNDYEQEIRISPDQLAALEQVLSDQQARYADGEDDDDEEGDNAGFYPKDKRSTVWDNEDDRNYDLPVVNADDVADDEDEDEEPTYLIPASMEPTSEYVQIPLAGAYENPYDFYQTGDDDSNVYEDALRRIDEEQLRQRIASLVDDINEQRRIARRRRRR